MSAEFIFSFGTDVGSCYLLMSFMAHCFPFSYGTKLIEWSSAV